MAARTWLTSVFLAAGVAAGAAAAQLGLAYGLGAIAWVPEIYPDFDTIWYASLAWVTWIASSSTIIGALVASRFGAGGGPAGAPAAGRGDAMAGAAAIVWVLTIALSAAVGALITVPLVAVPARAAQQATNSVPHFAASGYAVVGLVIGLLIAIGALLTRAVAANVLASAVVTWVVAAAAVTYSVRAERSLGTAQLGVWHFTDAVWLPGTASLPAALLMLALAFVVGVLAAWRPARRGANRMGVAVSGAAGPALVAAAYFLATPGVDKHDAQLSAYVIAPYAVLAGLAGSVLVAAMGPTGTRARRQARREAERLAARAADRDRREAPGTPTAEADQPAPGPATPAPARAAPTPAVPAPPMAGPSKPSVGRASVTRPGQAGPTT